MGGSPSMPTPPTVGEQLSSAINTLSAQGPQLAQAEGQIDPQMTTINDADTIQQVNQLSPAYFGLASQTQGQYENNQSQFNVYQGMQLGTVGQADAASLWNNNFGPTAQIQSNANKNLSTGVDSTLGGLEQLSASNPLAAGVNNTNSFVQSQLGGTSPLQGLTSLSAASQAANPQNAFTMNAARGANNQQWNAEAIGGALNGLGLGAGAANAAGQGNNAVSSAMQNNAIQQLGLGSSLSQQQVDTAAQVSRAADSARGVFHSDGSAANEVLHTDMYGQQLLQQREANAASTAGEVNAEQQTNVAQQNAAFGAANAFQGTANTFTSNMGNLISQNQQVANNMLTTANQQGQTEQQNQTSNAMSMSGIMQNALMGNIGQAVNTQNSALSNQFNYQNLGVQQLQYLSGLGQQDSMAAMQMINQGNPAFGGATQQASSLTQVTPNTAPSIMNSLNLFGAAQNTSNQAYAGQVAGAQSAANQQQAMIGAGVGAVGAIAGGVIAL